MRRTRPSPAKKATPKRPNRVQPRHLKLPAPPFLPKPSEQEMIPSSTHPSDSADCPLFPTKGSSRRLSTEHTRNLPANPTLQGQRVGSPPPRFRVTVESLRDAAKLVKILRDRTGWQGGEADGHKAETARQEGKGRRRRLRSPLRAGERAGPGGAPDRPASDQEVSQSAGEKS